MNNESMTPYAVAGRKIKELRKAKGWTQKEVVKKIGITEGFLSFLESGTKQGSLDTYIALCRLYEYPLHELFHDNVKVKTPRIPSIALDGLTKNEIRIVKKIVHALRANGS